MTLLKYRAVILFIIIPSENQAWKAIKSNKTKTYHRIEQFSSAYKMRIASRVARGLRSGSSAFIKFAPRAHRRHLRTQ